MRTHAHTQKNKNKKWAEWKVPLSSHLTFFLEQWLHEHENTHGRMYEHAQQWQLVHEQQSAENLTHAKSIRQNGTAREWQAEFTAENTRVCKLDL